MIIFLSPDSIRRPSRGAPNTPAGLTPGNEDPMPKATATITENSPFHNLPAADLADEYGRIGAEIAALEARRKAMAAELISRGESSVNGERFTATVVSEAMVATIDRKAIEDEMGEAWISRFLRWSKRCASVRTAPRAEAAAEVASA